jgi:hypothetical protein
VQEDAGLFWDNVNKRLGIGATPNTSTRLDVRAQGALSTDVAFRVRNSADTGNIIEVLGDGLIFANSNNANNVSFCVKNTIGFGVKHTDGTIMPILRSSSGNVIQLGDINAKNVDLSLLTNGATRIMISASGSVNFSDSVNMAFNTTNGTKIGTGTGQKLAFWNATPIVQPTTAVTAATLTSNLGTILTDTDTFDGYTLKQVVKALRNMGILA